MIISTGITTALPRFTQLLNIEISSQIEMKNLSLQRNILCSRSIAVHCSYNKYLRTNAGYKIIFHFKKTIFHLSSE